jgi:hypothetical protein
VQWEVYHLNYDLEGQDEIARPKGATLPLANKGNACCAS